MAFGNAVVHATMASADSQVIADLGGYWDKVHLEIPTMASVSALDVYVATDSTQTYYQLGKEVPNTTTVQAWSFTIAASAAANGRTVPFPSGFRYVKLKAADSAPSAAVGFKFICDSNS